MRYLLAVILASASFHRVFAVEYEVDGQLEQTIYKQDGSVGSARKGQFTVYVKDCSWLIRTTDLDKVGKPGAIRYTACVNGTEIYELSGPPDDGRTTSGPSSAPVNIARIVSNSVPVGLNEGYYVSHIWLMFASGCWFAKLSTNYITPVYDFSASAPGNPALKRRATWELFGGPGSLPLYVTYSKDAGAGGSSGSVDAIYAITGETNAGTVKIPSGFVFEKRTDYGYAPGSIPPGWSIPAYHISKRVVATVTAVRPQCSRKDLTPTAKGMTMVIDERATNFATLRTNLPTYIVKDGVQWLPLTKAEKAYMRPHAPPKPLSHAIVVVILLLPTALFASVWLLTRKRA
jgi:hypothetical protein